MPTTSQTQPPRLAAWLLRVALGREHSALVGDLAEEFCDHHQAYGWWRAVLLYWIQVAHIIPTLAVQSLLWHSLMLKNYLLVTLRTLRKNKGFSAINILSLALSMALCLLIILMIADQKSTDQFHSKQDRIHRVITELTVRSGPMWFATSPAQMADVLQTNYPGIEATLSMSRLRALGTADDRSFPVRGIYAEGTFFDFFDFPLRTGQPDQALTQPNTVVISEALAQKFFQEADPLGKTLTLDRGGEFLVTGVFEPIQQRSHLEFELVASYATLETQQRVPERWRNNVFSFYTYLLLEDGTTIDEIETHFRDVITNQFEGGDEFLTSFETQPVTGIKMGRELSNRLSSGMPPLLIYFLGGLGILIVLTACFNYVNLSVARSLQRAKEVGVRKTFGAHRSQVIKQFLSESVVIAISALLLGGVLLVWMIPAFNSLTFVQEIGLNLSFDSIDAPLVLLFFGFSLAVGLLAGLYPAVVLSAFRPVRVLRGLAVSGFAGSRLRKMLLVTQFTLSLLFIVSTLLFFEQSGLVLSADYGFDREHVLNIDLHDVPYETLRAELLRQPGVADVSAVSVIPATGDRQGLNIRLPGSDSPFFALVFSIDEHFTRNLKLDVVAGRAFSSEFATDKDGALMLNEAALRQWDLGSPLEAIGTVVQLNVDNEERPFEIVGIVKDFHFEDLDSPIRPLMLRLDAEGVRYANVRVEPLAASSVIANLKTLWEGLPTTHPFDYVFYDEQIAERYAYLTDVTRIVGVAASFAILIACLGLLGMASLTAQTRQREVGIRKVLGATTNHLVFLLSREFLLLVALAVVLAVPLAWFLNDLWLQEFVVRAHIGISVVALSVSALALLALLAMGSQTLKAALTNPVDTLRSE